MAINKELDIIVFGATGFTGKLVAEYLALYAKENLESFNWGIAGRNKQKLSELKDYLKLGDDVEIIEVDAQDDKGLADLCAGAKSVCTTVGPYQLYGEALIRACAQSGTHYTDLCGEPLFMRDMIEKYDADAKHSGAKIIFSTGFDSVPFDLGVYFLQQHAKKKFGAALSQINMRVRKMKGTFSGGTAASMHATTQRISNDSDQLTLLLNPLALAPETRFTPQPNSQSIQFDEDVDSWVAPFIMEVINSKTIHRSNQLLGYPYGEDFRYSEMMMTGPGDEGKAVADAMQGVDLMGGENAPKPGEGPSKEERETGYFDLLLVGKTEQGEELRASVTGDKDPGYGSTSKMMAQAALCVSKDDAALSKNGGIYTPASALGNSLIDRLEKHAGLIFQLEEASRA